MIEWKYEAPCLVGEIKGSVFHGGFDATCTGSLPVCKMADGEVKPAFVFHDDELMAYLDIGPIREGHVQIVPRQHFACFDDLPDGLASSVIQLGQKIARAQKKLLGVERVGFMFTGGDIPHAHAHLVPMIEKTDITSRKYIKEEQLTFAPVANGSPKELREIAGRLRQALMGELHSM